jgi:hypothetical protein
MKLMQSLPFSLAEPGPKDVDGVGNCEQLKSRGMLGVSLTSILVVQMS